MPAGVLFIHDMSECYCPRFMFFGNKTSQSSCLEKLNIHTKFTLDEDKH